MITTNTSSSATRSLRAAVALRDQECPSGGTPASRQIKRCKENVIDQQGHSYFQINRCKKEEHCLDHILSRSYFQRNFYRHPLFRRFLRQRREVALRLRLKNIESKLFSK